jgi:hypothetical protein
MWNDVKLPKQVKTIIVICLFFFCWFGGLYLVSLCKGYFYAKERAKQNEDLLLAYNLRSNSWPSSAKKQVKTVVAVSSFSKKENKITKPIRQLSLLEKAEQQAHVFVKSVSEINFKTTSKLFENNLLQLQPKQRNKIIIDLNFSNSTLKSE